eukprot:Colp12_sorted_trinity150504_noHs@17640
MVDSTQCNSTAVDPQTPGIELELVPSDQIANSGKKMEQAGKEVNESGKKESTPKTPMKYYYILTGSYLVYTLTDGALRMTILLKANEVGFTAFQIALMFSLYECLGIFTNLFGGVIGSRVGLKITLIAGLFFQLLSFALLFPYPYYGDALADKTSRTVYLMITQGLAGMAKDLVKVSGKSTSKLVTSDGQDSKLYKLVAFMTGFKNEFKGIGYFFGTLVYQYAGYIAVLACLSAFILVLIPICHFHLDHFGKSKNKIVWSKVFKKGRDFNVLCVARLFLFASRDIWFEVALPIFLKNVVEWPSLAVGSFLAGWVILYGVVQTYTKYIALKPIGCFPPTGATLFPWTSFLSVIALILAGIMTPLNNVQSQDAWTTVLVVGLVIYGFVFAVNSSVHSYLVVRLSDHDKVAQNVGFYYMSNAVGRLVGTLLGGVLYAFYTLPPDSVTKPDMCFPSHQTTCTADYAVAGRSISFTACLWGSAALVCMSSVASFYLRSLQHKRGEEEE